MDRECHKLEGMIVLRASSIEVLPMWSRVLGDRVIV
jgi:hypothetical protein